MIEFTMPALGSDMDEGTLIEWLVKPGDPITRGQVVAVVDTTKAAVDVECWHEGTVEELLVPVGKTVQVGTPLARLRGVDDAPSTATAPAPGIPEQSPSHRRWISPAARRLAAAKAVDIESLTGTGPRGAITLSDVENAGVPPAQPVAPAARRTSAVRTSIAAAMSRSKREIPHYYLGAEIPMDESMHWLRARNAQGPVTDRLLPAVLQLKAVALAAQRFGEFNGFWRDGDFRPAPDVHVGVAISLRTGGLVAPAIHDVPAKPLDDLMSELSDLVERARAGSLRSSEMSDPTITITNLGELGVDSVFGVIYPPQVALVGFGAARPRVRAVDGGIRIVDAVEASLSADHRVSDGHRGARFLSAIAELLQQPQRLEK